MAAARQRKTRKPTVSVVGSGRLGTALARALKLAGYQLQAVVARRKAHALKAAKLLGRPTLALNAHELHLLPASKIIFITTPDDEISRTAAQLAMQEAPAQRRTVLHTSGALSSSEVLATLATKGFNIGSLHPLVSVNDSVAGAGNLHGAFYCIEGDTAATHVARAIVRDLKGQSFQISSRSKPIYHAAAVMASGNVIALFAIATDLLEKCGIEAKTARRILLPLLESTVANLSRSDPSKALTGTFARGDLATAQRHLEALSDKQFGDALAAYKLLGRRSLEIAKETLDPDVRKQILGALKKFNGDQ